MPEGNVIPLPTTPNRNNTASKPLPPTVRHEFESKMGQNFSDIRVSENHQPVLLGAQAFTQGNEIFFAPAQYQPHTEAGNRLIGCELAHVVQQRSGVTPNSGLAQNLVEVGSGENNNNE